jgi:hypothetical protein
VARKKVKAPKRKRKVQHEKVQHDDALPNSARVSEFPDGARVQRAGRKRLGRKGGGSKPARGDSDDDAESDSDVAEAELRRPRRKVVAALSDSDDDDAPVPAAMGGDALAGDIPTTARPSFLFDEDE